MPQQQLLDLFNQQYEFNTFIATDNEISVSNLQNFSNQYTHIYGKSLSGKTHLLKAWVNLAKQKYSHALFLNSKNLANGELNNINLEQFRFIALDNIDYLTDDLQIELFDLFNHIKLNNRNNYLLTSSQVNLNQSNLRVDLKTRILSGLVFALKSLNDDELFNALLIYTKREGIKLNELELKYILTHYTRNLGQLINLICRISNYAVVGKKPITTTLIKQVISTKNTSKAIN